MPEELVFYITKYGYLAIFILVFLQETGMPNPFPNELLLMFTGYLAYKGLLFLPLLILTAVGADFSGTCILYFLFYKAGSVILKRKPKWLPLSEKILNRLSKKIPQSGGFTLFLFRLTPFTRGYASVIAGLIGIKTKAFLPIAIGSAVMWASFYTVTGYIIGPVWDQFALQLDNFRYFMIGILILIILIVIVTNYSLNREKNKVSTTITENCLNNQT
jgi:membrane protein DedA with SNARE-associated domain